MRESSGDIDLIEAVGTHVEQHIGAVATVLHEIASPEVHVDVYVVEPTAQRPYYTLLTAGMSERPMSAPPDVPDGRFAEVLLCLPRNWPLSQEAFKQEENWWPIRLLKTLARHPHEQETWLYWGHTLALADPPEPFASNTRMSSVLLLEPRLIPPVAHHIYVGKGKDVRLWGAFPLYQEELDLKLENGAERLEELFAARGVTELLDIQRPTVASLN